MIRDMAEQRSVSPEVNDQGSSTSEPSSPTRPERRRRPRTTTVLALVLGVAFAGAVLAGAKVLVDRNVYTHVAMGPVDSPDAASATCREIIGALPDRTADYRSVGVVAPAPDGVAAYRDSGGTELTVRCGVNVPSQYTTVSSPVEHGGTDWLRVDDATPGSDLSTWYSLGDSPVVAVTGTVDQGSSLDRMIDFDGIGDAVAAHATGDAPTPRELPLAGLKSDRAADSGGTCTSFRGALPDSFGDYRRITETTTASPDTAAGTGLDSLGVAVWTAPGKEPVVVRCGVAMPDSYAAGARLTQVNKVPWFEDSALASGSTAGVWYAIGHSPIVAVSLPQDMGDSVLPLVSGVISRSLTATGK